MRVVKIVGLKIKQEGMAKAATSYTPRQRMRLGKSKRNETWMKHEGEGGNSRKLKNKKE